MRTSDLNERLQDYLTETKESIELSESLNKSNTQRRIIEPFFDVLNWPLRIPKEDLSVEFDYNVNSHIVDYALIVNGEEELFVQSNGFQDSLPSESVVEEVLEQNFNWGVITDGHDYKVYRQIDNNLELIDKFDLDNVDSHIEFLTYLTADSFTSGRTSEESEQYDLRVQDQRTIEDLENKLTDELSNSIKSLDNNTLTSEIQTFTDNLEQKTTTHGFFTVDDTETTTKESEEETTTNETYENDEQDNDDASENDLRFQDNNSDDSENNQESDIEGNGDSSSDSSNESSENSSEDLSEDTDEEGSKSLGSRLFSIVTAIL